MINLDSQKKERNDQSGFIHTCKAFKNSSSPHVRTDFTDCRLESFAYLIKNETKCKYIYTPVKWFISVYLRSDVYT
jgi:hypothetical protein